MEELGAITPINFFQLSLECQRVESGFPKISSKNRHRFLLPSTSDLCAEWSFAEVAMGWNVEGIECFIAVDQAVHRVVYPNISQGDSIELFIDTRDVKTSGFNTRFCHHFFFLPESIEGHQAGEITHFRGEERHEMCDPNELLVKASSKGSGYHLQLFIPRFCLFGYDPEQFGRLGFSYRINRATGPSQHFSVVSNEFAVEQQPSLWSSVRLVG